MGRKGRIAVSGSLSGTARRVAHQDRAAVSVHINRATSAARLLQRCSY
jgi:hypothetical protein